MARKTRLIMDNRSLKGKEIHICSRILRGADAFDAITSSSEYHKKPKTME